MFMPHQWITLVLGRILFVLVLCTLSACTGLTPAGIAGPRPNIVVILTDDMDLSLMPHLPSTRALIADEGATFTNFFVTSPVCCPSRATLLRGQYPHNTRILANTSPEGGFRRFYQYQAD
jgi:arylsulfatase A-like enzyme